MKQNLRVSLGAVVLALATLAAMIFAWLNFIQRETMNFAGNDLESYCQFIADKFMRTYPQTEGAQLTASEIPYSELTNTGLAFAPGGPDRAWPSAR